MWPCGTSSCLLLYILLVHWLTWGSGPIVCAQEVDIFVGPITGSEMAVPWTQSSFISWHLRNKEGTKCYVADIRNGKTLEPFPVTTPLECKALSPDGQLFATFGRPSPKVSFYSTATGKVTKEFPAAEFTSIGDIGFLSPEQMIVFGYSQKAGGAIYSVKTGKLERWLDISVAAMRYKVSSTGQLLAFHREEGTVLLIDARTGKQRHVIKLEPDHDYASPTVLDVAFCNQGNDLIVLCTGKRSGFRVYDTKSGKLKLKHSLNENLNRIAPLSKEYHGPAVEELPDNRGWLLYGRAVVDPKIGGPVWIEKPNGMKLMSVYRVMIDRDRQLTLEGDLDKQRITTVQLPWPEIQQSREVYVKDRPSQFQDGKK